MAGPPLAAGYTDLVGFLASHHDILTLKRFRELQIRNLLFYQAELANLQQELEIIEVSDARYCAKPKERVGAKWTPSMAVKTLPSVYKRTHSDEYIDTVLKLRQTLKDYNDAVEQYRRLNEIPNPRRRDIKTLRTWLDDQDEAFEFLKEQDADVWQPNNGTDDFYSFSDNSRPALLLGYLIYWLRQLVRCCLPTNKEPFSIDTTGSGRLGRGISTVVASVLPVLPIIVFYFVDALLTRLGLILLFTAVFAAVLVWGLEMKSDTTLGITTAIAAIQVVYVGTTAPSTG